MGTLYEVIVQGKKKTQRFVSNVMVAVSVQKI